MENNNESLQKIQQLVDENENLKRFICRLEKTLKQYDIEEIEDVDDVEYICVQQIKKLKLISEIRNLDKDEVKNLDILHHNLRSSRGQITEKRQTKKEKVSVGDLLKIVEDDG